MKKSVFNPHRINRRSFLKVAGSAVSAVAATGYLGFHPARRADAGPGGEVVYSGFGGNYEQKMREAILEPFTKQTGITVKVTTGAFDTAKLAAMVKAGQVEWDLVDGGTTLVGPRIQLGLVEPIDYQGIDASDFLAPAYKHTYGVGIYAFSHNIYWNTKAIHGPLTGWADVWNTARFPGKRGFLRIGEWIPEEAALADGVLPSRLYPLDVDRVFRALDRIKPSAVFLDLNALNNQIAQQDIVTGDLNLARVQQAIRDGVPLAYTWNQAIVDIDRLMVPKGAKNAANALRLIQFALQPEQQFQLNKLLGYSPATKSGFSRLPKDSFGDLAASPVTRSRSIFLDVDWWAKGGNAMKQRFQEWLLR